MGKEDETSEELSHWVKRTIEIAKIVEEHGKGVTELELQEKGFSVRLKLRPGMNQSLSNQVSSLKETPVETYEDRDKYYHVKAPLTGIWYESPDPKKKPFVEVGNYVEEHTDIGLIESMKTFNHITADANGSIEVILAKNGQIVHVDDTLMIINKTTSKPEMLFHATS